MLNSGGGKKRSYKEKVGEINFTTGGDSEKFVARNVRGIEVKGS